MQFTLVGLWAHMGLFARVIVGVLALMSLFSLVVMAERAITYVRSNRESRRFASSLAQALAGGDVETAAREKSGRKVGHLGRVLAAGLGAYRISSNVAAPGDATVESVARALERQGAREVQSLKRGLNWLATVGSTAPFIGLLGTVMGIINAFQQMSATGSGGLATVSAGISEALVTTAFGLLVAIPAVMAYNYLQGWVDARAVDMSESSNELLDVVARRFATERGATAFVTERAAE